MLSTPDIIRQQFREALQAGTSPRIEDFLTHVDDTQQLDLFQECIRLELIFCRQQGTQYDFTSLHHRFPQFSDAVENIRQTYVDSANESAGSPRCANC